MPLSPTPERARIYRIVHIKNVEWILRHRCLVSRNATVRDPDYVEIGSPEIIGKRKEHHVPVPPYGTYGDYVPFYFTPCSMMMLNILTGRGVPQRSRDEIVVFVSSIHLLKEQSLPFVFTNQHACTKDVQFFSKTDDLNRVDWALLLSRDFRARDDDPNRGSRYQAEAMVHEKVPLEAILGLACHSEQVQKVLLGLIEKHNSELEVRVLPSYYFPRQ